MTEMLPAGDAIHAGFWRRGAALTLDGLVLSIPIFLLALIPVAGIVLIVVGRWLYFALLESSAAQATLGKRAMGIKVTDGAGNRISFGQATGRYVGALLSRLILYIGFMLAGWTERKQALHDLMANCCVVFRDVEPGQPLPSLRPPMPWYGWVLNVLLGGAVPGIAILAAIALPAYQDYVVRARVSEAMVLADGVKSSVAEFRLAKGRCPKSNAEAGVGDASSIHGQFVSSLTVSSASDGTCVIRATFGGGGNPAVLRGKQIFFTTDNPIAGWKCGGDMPQRYLPLACRGN